MEEERAGQSQQQPLLSQLPPPSTPLAQPPPFAPPPPKDIGWKELDKKRFFLILPISSIAHQMILFPSNLVKTRMQTVRVTGDTPYKSTFDAYRTIFRKEGWRGFYKGFSLSLVNVVVASPFYITTFEVTRAFLIDTFQTNIPQQYLSSQNGLKVAAFLAAPIASAAVITTATPIDIVVQRWMVQRGSGKVHQSYVSHFQDIWHKEGFLGLYRGYWLSILTTLPTSAIVWSSYYHYRDMAAKFLHAISPADLSGSMRRFEDTFFNSPVSGALAGVTGAVITNPFDLTRAQIQVQETKRRVFETAREHVSKHGLSGLWHGTGARSVNMALTWSIAMTFYELLKQASVKD